MSNCAQCGRKLPPLTFGKKLCQWCVQHEAAQRGEVAEDASQRVMAAPWVRRQASITLTQVLLGANVAVFVAMLLANKFNPEFPPLLRFQFGANYGPRTLTGDWWRLFTYMFLHGDFWHIAFNMWCLWDLGALCESFYGRWTFAAIYGITGIAAGISSVAWNPGVNSVGASGAIFGLAGALIASFYLGEFSLPKIAIRGTLRSLAFFVVINVLFGAGLNIFGGGYVAIDNAAHIGGLISGLILGALIARVAPQHDAPLRRLGVLAVVALAVSASALGVEHWRGGPYRLGQMFESVSENKPNAIAQLQAIVRQHPNVADGHFALGQAYFNQEKYPEAEAEFRRGLEIDPGRTDARFDLGLTYLNLNRTAEAKSAFTQILANNANYADAHYGMGLALATEGQHAAAVEEFKAAVQAGSQAPGNYYEMGRSYAKLQKYDEAIAAFLKEKDIAGDDADIENALADAYQAKGMTQQAEQARTKANEIKNGNHH